jgi:hypothetical protein
MFIICASACVELGMQLLNSMNNVCVGSLSEISINTNNDRNNAIGQGCIKIQPTVKTNRKEVPSPANLCYIKTVYGNKQL